MMNSLRKNERLSSQKEIALLVKEGNTFLCYPFRIMWSVSRNERDHSFRIQSAFSVPKKKFKKAVKRNKIRRRMKEAFRLQKEPFKKEMTHHPFTLSLLIIYTPHKELNYAKIEAGMKKSFQMLKKVLSEKTP
ncbi:MAG: ribonuclease P protein component [Bacteroidales bacterium]|nr:ribonuclease P protein component [Bacteroidales bacterium]